MTAETTPLLPSDHAHLQSPLPTPAQSLPQTQTSPHSPSPSTLHAARHQTARFLTSKYGHYAVLILVSIDVTSIFVDLLGQLLTCEGRIPLKEGGVLQEVLGTLGLVFSCMFMLELGASVWAFGFGYFTTWFHCLDAIVILAGFIVDVVLKGVLEEVGSLVVTLRLWRVFKIIEELSAGAEEQMEPMQERLEGLEKENEGLRRQVEILRGRGGEGRYV
ncbi:hypothetical protein LTR62_007345 [Meristemomyces frigidus]|uniref:Voltage-gated hydrogen channel 1 n=1 Tax=Meristemomyces frigidus TaxID=1508187 RepID=A0AAN7TH26_9PEZI|nr:hypothetical protein LTR62_007345 [Meristemomyces frigidus]